MAHKVDVSEEFAREIAHGLARKIAVGIALLFGFAFFVVFGGFLVQWLWNWLVTDLFGLRRITLWEALGLLALSRIMFGSFGGGSHGRQERRDWWKRKQRQPPAASSMAPPAGDVIERA